MAANQPGDLRRESIELCKRKNEGGQKTVCEDNILLLNGCSLAGASLRGFGRLGSGDENINPSLGRNPSVGRGRCTDASVGSLENIDVEDNVYWEAGVDAGYVVLEAGIPDAVHQG